MVEINGTDYRGAEGKELGILVRAMARLEEITDASTTDGPVDVFARAIDTSERLLGEEADETMLSRNAPEQGHREHLVVMGDVRRFVNWSDFVLGRSHFVVAGLDGNPELEALAFGFHHAGKHAIRNRAEVLVFELLTLRRLRPEERTATGVKVGAKVEET